MIDVEQGTLCAFEEYPSAAAPFAVQQIIGRRHERQNFRRDGEQFLPQRLTVDRHSVDIAFESLRLQQQSYQVGTTNVLALITAQRLYAQARLSYATAQIQQFQDTAGLLTALGGGWWQDTLSGFAGQPQ